MQTPTEEAIVEPSPGPTPVVVEDGNGVLGDGDAGPLTVEVPRIEIRVVDGVGRFENSATGDVFVPRGVNYVDFVPNADGGFHDGVFATNSYDPDRVRAAFRKLAGAGYNTVRIFFDTCGFGPECIGHIGGAGLNPEYLDNMVDTMVIAGEEGIYLLLTANSIPDEGGYWPYFDRQITEADVRYGFSSYENADWLHPAGMEIRRRYWQDLMDGMTERRAPAEVVLGWQITNEAWLFSQRPPLSLDEGIVEPANGGRYDLADPEQKRAMVTDGWLHVMDEIIPIIHGFDPDALTTMGFFAPQFPNETSIGGDWYVDTAPMVSIAPVDFWDFHAYYDTDLSIEAQAENFGMIADQRKPVIMGETASGQAIHPSAVTSLAAALDWYERSCDVGFDGWLHWGYYPWPAAVDGKPWTLLDEGGLLFDNLSPAAVPDPCDPPEPPVRNVATGRPVRASSELSGEPASAAVDGTDVAWVSGDYPPAWIAVDLDEPSTVARIGISPLQWPAGDARYQISAVRSDGTVVVVAQHDRYTAAAQALGWSLPQPLTEVVSVRVEFLEAPAWAALTELEVTAGPTGGAPCVLSSADGTELFRYPRPDAEVTGQITPGLAVYADARFVAADGSVWWHVPGDAWFDGIGYDAPEACDAVRVEEAVVEVALTPVTFVVEVPRPAPEEVYLAGDFGREDIPVWQPWSVLLSPGEGARWTVTLELPVGAEVEYVYTRNSWDSIERPESCGETLPRSITVTDDAATHEDRVVGWEDTDCG